MRGEVDMPPGLRPIGGGGEVGRDGLGRVVCVVPGCPAPVQGTPLQVAGTNPGRRGGGPVQALRGVGRLRYGAARRYARSWSVVPPTPRRRCRTDPQACSAPAGRDSRRSSPWRRRIPSIRCRRRHRRSSRWPGRRETRPTCRRRICRRGSRLSPPPCCSALAAEIVAAGPVELDKCPRLAPGCRGTGLDVEPRLLRAQREDPVAARMVGRLRDDCRGRG